MWAGLLNERTAIRLHEKRARLTPGPFSCTAEDANELPAAVQRRGRIGEHLVVGDVVAVHVVARGPDDDWRADAGVRRIIVTSIIGVDRFTTGYLAEKIPHEKAMLSGFVSVRILRPAQFHELVGADGGVGPAERRELRVEQCCRVLGQRAGPTFEEWLNQNVPAAQLR